jgi:hypothetical protein
MSTWELIKYPGVARVLVIYNYIAILAFTYTAVNPVFLYTPVSLGGIGFQPELIAGAIGLNGVSQALWILLIFAPLQRRINTGGILRLCAAAWPFFFALHPLCHFLRRWDLPALFWAVGPVGLAVGSGVAMAFSKLSPFPLSPLPVPLSLHIHISISIPNMHNPILTTRPKPPSNSPSTTSRPRTKPSAP